VNPNPWPRIISIYIFFMRLFYDTFFGFYEILKLFFAYFIIMTSINGVERVLNIINMNPTLFWEFSKFPESNFFILIEVNIIKIFKVLFKIKTKLMGLGKLIKLFITEVYSIYLNFHFNFIFSLNINVQLQWLFALLFSL